MPFDTVVTETALKETARKDSALAPTPPMGWNSWNRFRCYGLSEEVVLGTADALVASGMRDAGYEYLVIDDCWQAMARGADGSLLSNPERFPHGMKWLGEQIHARGLKFGLYLAPGRQTCAMLYDSYPARELGSFGNEELDVATLVGWGVDYLKYDWCQADAGGTGLSYPGAFERMARALAAAPRPIVLSISEYGKSKPWEWAGDYAHLWRTTSDINASWRSVMRLVDSQHGLARFAGPGGWNDPDMLEVGNDGLTPVEARSHLMLWAMLAAPLMAGNDLREMSAETRELLTHRGILDVSQDALGWQGERVARFGQLEIWRRELGDGHVIGLLNRSRAWVDAASDGVSLLADARDGAGMRALAALPEGAVDVWTGAAASAASWRLAPHEMLLLRGR
ncbi:glycoside hydrolase family 27 protein [Microterricola pindariensis]|uniref:Alpha-galactosidase n=1 Tax=Microterricola pindariensis TaxID=478010 RepID=A0ABX5ATQ8_9MICO|nr:glycoside hydrolase family 27 protein [Microterricola pindariensis]PPL16837.1 hypothetical protein GY24_12200 [Microterricola pindariensis]